MTDFIPLMKPRTYEHVLNLLEFAVQHAGIIETEKAIQEWLVTHEDSLTITIDKKEVKVLHPIEQNYPEQTKRFREILDEMYKIHLKKNNDYSAYNILGTGEVGLTVRFWDKCARLMNLMGFDIGTGRYTGTKKNLVLDETVLDTVMDAAVYSIIFKIYSEGKWGK